MFYFGPWDQAGHYLRGETVAKDLEERRALSRFQHTNPWGLSIDGGLCPKNGGQGYAVLHHKDGWTAMAFWDFTVDTRPGSNSTYLAEGTFTFEEMVEMAKRRFAYRWNKINFAVTQAPGTANEHPSEATQHAGGKQ